MDDTRLVLSKLDSEHHFFSSTCRLILMGCCNTYEPCQSAVWQLRSTARQQPISLIQYLHAHIHLPSSSPFIFARALFFVASSIVSFQMCVCVCTYAHTRTTCLYVWLYPFELAIHAELWTPKYVYDVFKKNVHHVRVCIRATIILHIRIHERSE